MFIREWPYKIYRLYFSYDSSKNLVTKFVAALSLTALNAYLENKHHFVKYDLYCTKPSLVQKWIESGEAEVISHRSDCWAMDFDRY